MALCTRRLDAFSSIRYLFSFIVQLIAGAPIAQRRSAKRPISTIICKTTPTIVRPSVPCAKKASKISKIWHRTYDATKISESICATSVANGSVRKAIWSIIGIHTSKSAIFIAICAHNRSNRHILCALIATAYTRRYSDTSAKNADENSSAITILLYVAPSPRRSQCMQINNFCCVSLFLAGTSRRPLAGEAEKWYKEGDPGINGHTAGEAEGDLDGKRARNESNDFIFIYKLKIECRLF